MEKDYTAMINEAIKCLNWAFILKCYSENKLEWFEYNDGKKKKPKKIQEKGAPSEAEIKKDLKNIIKFVISHQINEFMIGHWLIFWMDSKTFNTYIDETQKDDLGSQLEIIFCPSRSISFENEPYLEDKYKDLIKDTELDKMELTALKDLLVKSVGEENYELAAVVRDRIKKVQKTIQHKIYK